MTTRAPLQRIDAPLHRKLIAIRANAGLPMDGSEPMTGDLDMGGNEIINLPGWTTPAFSAGNFTASGSMTWTVESADVLTYAYNIIGKQMTVAFVIGTSTVGGTLSNRLNIAIPASKVATKRMETRLGQILDAGVASEGFCVVEASGTTIGIFLQTGGNFSAGTNNVWATGTITFEIN